MGSCDEENSLRTDHEWTQALQKLESASGQSRKNVEMAYGITRRAKIFDIKALSVPTSFPIEIMHLMFANLLGFFIKSFLDPEASLSPFSKSEWKRFGHIMKQNQKNFPFGPLRDISSMSGKKKADQLKVFGLVLPALLWAWRVDKG